MGCCQLECCACGGAGLAQSDTLCVCPAAVLWHQPALLSRLRHSQLPSNRSLNTCLHTKATHIWQGTSHVLNRSDCNPLQPCRAPPVTLCPVLPFPVCPQSGMRRNACSFVCASSDTAEIVRVSREVGSRVPALLEPLQQPLRVAFACEQRLPGLFAPLGLLRRSRRVRPARHVRLFLLADAARVRLTSLQISAPLHYGSLAERVKKTETEDEPRAANDTRDDDEDRPRGARAEVPSPAAPRPFHRHAIGAVRPARLRGWKRWWRRARRWEG